VVESLAADKAAQDEVIASLRKDNYALRNEILLLQSKIAEQSKLLENVGELLAKNSEGSLSSKIALLERCEQLPDRFEGESRDHVIEVIKAAREQAEKDGRLRLAQILEGVLVNNEPSGNLVERRENLKQLFIDNGHIISGPVINELDKLGISYKNGEEYLLTSEIILRNY
jgi:DNA polymerase III delta prime subunit